MAAKYILSAVAIVFLVAAAYRWFRRRGALDAAARTWLTIAAIFAAVSAWLWHTS